MQRLFVLAVAATIGFFTLQAACWPLAMNPGVHLHFWQMQWAAEIGYRVGAPVVAAILFLPMAELVSILLAIGMSTVWAAAIGWVVHIGIRNIPQQQTIVARDPTEIISQASTPMAQDTPAQTPAQLARSAARPSAPSD